MNKYDIIAEISHNASNLTGKLEQAQKDIASQKSTIEVLEHGKELVKRNIQKLSGFMRNHDLSFLSLDASIYDATEFIISKIKKQSERIHSQNMKIVELSKIIKDLKEPTP
jgi:chromosome segregation ATPase